MAYRKRKNRRDRVKEARKRVRFGHYDRPAMLGGIVDELLEGSPWEPTPLLVQASWQALDAVPVGNGLQYQQRVERFLSCLLNDLLDAPNSANEVRNHGAKIDIEFPLRLEVLDRFPLFKQWADWYCMRSVLVEVKNEHTASAVEDPRNVAGHLTVAQRGRFGFLIARSGFKPPAMRFMGELARQGRYLVLPLSHSDLGQLAMTWSPTYATTMQFLRARQSELLRVA